MKDDIEELKLRLTPGNATLQETRIIYYDSQTNDTREESCYFSDLPQELYRGYLSIIQSIFAAKYDEKIINMNIKADNTISHELKMLIDTKLASDEEVDKILERIKAVMSGKYLILITHDTYDVVKRATDNTELDESELVYDYMVVVVCKINNSPQRLTYTEGEGFGVSISQLEVQAPFIGFTYPAFINREADYNMIMYYTSNNKMPDHNFMENNLECTRTYTATEKRELLRNTIKDCVKSEDDTQKILKSIYIKLAGLYASENERDKILTAELLLSMMQDINVIDKYRAINIAQNYKIRAEPFAPTIDQLMDKRLVKAALKEQKNQRVSELLMTAAMAIELNGESDLSREMKDTAKRSINE